MIVALSLSPRRAWIEITSAIPLPMQTAVALHTEGVG